MKNEHLRSLNQPNPLTKPAAPNSTTAASKDAEIKALETAREFEAVFVSQMLKYSGFTKALAQQTAFGGEAYSDMLTQQYADKIIENGGFGLAEKIYRQFSGKETSS